MQKGDSIKQPIDSRCMGLLVIAVIILVIVLVRWGSYIAWGAR